MVARGILEATMFAAMALAAALAVTPTSAPNTQIDPSIAMGLRPQNNDAFEAYNRARAADQQYRMNEAAMEAARAEAAAASLRDQEAARQLTESRAEGVRRANESQAAAALLREQVGGLLASDDCPGAVRAALAGGDFSLAREAREFCAGTTPAPAAPK